MQFTTEQLDKIEASVLEYLKAQDIDESVAKELAHAATFEACHPCNLVGDESVEDITAEVKESAHQLYKDEAGEPQEPLGGEFGWYEV